MSAGCDNWPQAISQAECFCSSYSRFIVLLEIWWDRLDDLFSLVGVVNFESNQVFWGSELELGNAILSVFLDGDLFSAGQVLLFSSHDFDEVLQILDFLGL